MKGLLHVIGRPVTKQTRKPNFSFFHSSTKYMVHYMGGYWCRFGKSQWARHLKIPTKTLRDYLSKDLTLQEIINRRGEPKIDCIGKKF